MLALQAIRETAAVTIRGIELAAKIKKQQFDLKPSPAKPPLPRKFGPRCWRPEICNASHPTKRTLNKICNRSPFLAYERLAGGASGIFRRFAACLKSKRAKA
jgi:hypothetical protein